MAIDGDDARRVSETLAKDGHVASRSLGDDDFFHQSHSPGHHCRASLDGTDVEVLHVGCERDREAHEAWLSAYAATLAPSGTVGRRRLGAGVECLTFVPAR